MDIAVMAGGISPERNVSLVSGKAVADALLSNGHSVTFVDPALGADCIIPLDELNPSAEIEPSAEELQAFSPKDLLACAQSPVLQNVEKVFIALHGKYGEDGYIQSLLDLQQIRYTGSRRLASSMAMNKVVSKRLFESSHISTPAWTPAPVDRVDDYEFLQEVRSTFGERLVFKPADQGSAVGVSIVQTGNLDDMNAALKTVAKYSPLAVVEQYIDGRDFTVGILGDEVTPIVEVRPVSGLYDYEHKYTPGKTEYICPAEYDEYATSFVQDMALNAHYALNCHAFSRVDFRVSEEGEVYCLEVNTIPGLTPSSLLPKGAAALGHDFVALCEKIIELS